MSQDSNQFLKLKIVPKPIYVHNTLKIALANVVRLLAEQSETKSNVELDRFRSWLQASYVLATLKSSDRTKQSVCGWLYIYIYI